MAESRPVSPEPSGERNAAKDRQALDRLEARISAARQKLEPKRRADPGKYHSLTLAWRMVLELVIGCGIGAGLGHGLDLMLGTGPLLLIVFGALGLAAGVKTMMSSAHEVQRRYEAQRIAAEEGGARGEQ